MAKKDSGKVIQMLSPENYIRTKSRTLPLYECLINPDWEETKQAGCIISRKHSNGNISYCFYFVDLLCLGVKFTHFSFNETLSRYNEFIAESKEDISLELVDYAVVHNVIHAGIEYAEDYEFMPHKDFTSVTKYFLEKDSDDIEFMEIDCGDDDGQPVYLYSSTTTPSQEKDRIIAHLERIAGPDNYTLLDEDEVTDEEEDYNEDFDDQEDIYTQKSFEENKEIFVNLLNGLKKSDDPNDFIRLRNVSKELFLRITDSALVDQHYSELIDGLSIHVENEEIPNEILGLKPEVELNEELYELFMSVFLNMSKNLNKARKGLKLFLKESGEIPAAAFLELLLLQKENSGEFAETLQKYARKYPDYSMITLMWLNDIYSLENVPEEFANENYNLETLFPGRNSVHFLEMFYYLIFIAKVIEYEKNADKMEAFYRALDQIDLPEGISEIIENSFLFTRIEYLAEYFNIEVA